MKLQGYISKFDEGDNEGETYITLRLTGNNYAGGMQNNIKATLKIEMKRGMMKDYKIGDQFEVNVEGKTL